MRRFFLAVLTGLFATQSTALASASLLLPAPIAAHSNVADTRTKPASIIGAQAGESSPRAVAAMTAAPMPPRIPYAPPRPSTGGVHVLPRDPNMPTRPIPPAQLRRPSGAPAGSRASAIMQPMTVNSAQPATNGIQPWWTYDSFAVPGVGTGMLNVANGNLLILPKPDIAIRERGIGLTFQRVYNLQSAHDYANSDGSVQSNYGNGWTNNFDMHVANNSQGGISLYDAYGTRFDYASNGSNPCLIPPTGVYDQLCAIVSNGVTTAYQWTRKDGTVYQFNPPGAPVSSGRLETIWARNSNNNVTFTYAVDGGGVLSTVTATHSDGHALVLNFQNSGTDRELSSITRPDGDSVVFGYDGNGQLTNACDLGNGATDNGNYSSVCTNQPAGVAVVHSQYAYYSGGNGYLLEFAYSPNRVMSSGSSTGGAIQGYSLVSSNMLASFANTANVQLPSSGDGVSTTMSTYYTRSYSYASGSNAMTDTDGHGTTWTFDTVGRVSTLAQLRGQNHTALTSYYAWDSNNHLTQYNDPRQSISNFAYDTNGNLSARAGPSVSSSNATFRPTALYSYDANSNLLAYCDPAYTHSSVSGGDWTATPPPNKCPTSAPGPGAVRFLWTPAPNNLTGEITDAYTNNGYHYAYSYDGNGLPTAIVGDTITQNVTGAQSSVIPSLQFKYDGYGNPVCFSNLTNSAYWSHAIYDTSNNLPKQISNADDAALSNSGCSSTPGLGSHATIVTTFSYEPNGQVATSQTPSQAAVTWRSPPGPAHVSYSYDGDGNLLDYLDTLSFVVSGPGVITRWYDGADRLVEVKMPPDQSVDNNVPNATRYFYDLSKDTGNLHVGGVGSFYAYGNLYKTQRCIAAASGGSCTWTDVSGTAYDWLDRPTTRFNAIPPVSGQNTMQSWNYTYDASGPTIGLLASVTDPIDATDTLSYDAAARVLQEAFSGAGTLPPGRTYTYDADDRLLSAAQTNNSSVTYSYAFDHDGNLTSKTEPRATGLTANPVISYDYYPNDWRKDLFINAPPAISGTTLEMTYGYGNDGRLQALHVKNYPSTYTWTYTPAGRPTTLADPFTNTQVGETILAHTWNYDSHGQVASERLPNQGQYSTVGRDPEGEPTSYGIALPWHTPANNDVSQMAYSYNAKAELFDELATTVGNQPFDNRWQDLWGHMCVVSSCGTIDPNTGALLAGPAQALDGCSGSFTAAYDVDGRLTTYMGSEGSVGQNCNPSNPTLEDSRGYDSDNHTASDQCSPDPIPLCTIGTRAYSWAPTGQMSRYTFQSYGYNLHWDGNRLLFITDDSGALAQLNIAGVGAITGPTAQYPNEYSGLTVFDRDLTGALSLQHQSGGASTWTVAQSQYSAGKRFPFLVLNGILPGFGTFNAPTYVDSSRPDGTGIGSLTFQGARAYDPFATQWTSPDKYPGRLANPMTQAAYVWNGNNPIMNRDPSGYSEQVPADDIPPGCYFWGYGTSGPTGSSASGYSCEYEDTGFGPLYPYWAAITDPLIGWGDQFHGVTKRILPSAYQISGGFQAGLFGLDANVGITNCGQTFGGITPHGGAPFTISRGFSAMALWSLSGNRNAFVGNGWSVTGGYYLGGQVGGPINNGNVGAPGYFGLGITAPGAQLSTGKSNAGPTLGAGCQ